MRLLIYLNSSLNHLQSKPRTKGFTLIEILLVIAILGMIASLSLTIYEKRAMTSKIDKTTLEMQGIMQAASAYYVANDHWPASTALTSIIPDDFLPFLPVYQTTTSKQLLNPWGFPYSIDGSTSKTKQKFLVSTQAPDIQTAARMAMALPFGSILGTTTIQAYMPTPGSQGTASNLIIWDVGNINSDQTDRSSLPVKCPLGWNAYAALAANDVTANKDDYNANNSTLKLKVKTNTTDIAPFLCTHDGTDPHWWTCYLRQEYQYGYWEYPSVQWRSGTKGTTGYLYITYCKPPT